MKKINQYTFIALYTTLFLLILYKVIHVPITHDESATTVQYARYSFREIMMYPDPWPNNHIVNTLLTKTCIWIFGPEQWAVRLPNMLSFILYAIGVYRICKTALKENSILFLPASILFVANPYLLDFFGLSRGYGLSCAFATLSLSYLVSGFASSKNKHIWWAVALSMLAAYANFTLLVFWAAINLLAAFYFFSRFRTSSLPKPGLDFLKNIGIMGGLALAYAALIYNPIYKMQSTNQFQFWTAEGFYKETLEPLVYLSRYGSKQSFILSFRLMSKIICGIIALNGILVITRFIRARFKLGSLNHPLVITTTVLVLTTAISILQTHLLHSPNLKGRTALFFYPLFIASVTALFGMLSTTRWKIPQAIFAICISVLCLMHLADRTKLKTVAEWAYDENTLEVLSYLKRHRGEEYITLKTNWLFHPSFNFYFLTGKTPWLKLYPYDKEIEPGTSAEYYYVEAENYPLLETQFDIVHRFDDARWLLRKKPEYRNTQ